ncbi:hypothetical protein M8C21_032177, partial [Ambrosia artemisiifolia]
MTLMYQVEYLHIKAWLTMQDIGMSSEALFDDKTQESSDVSVNEKSEVVTIDDSPRNRPKIDVPEEENRLLMEVKETSILSWLQNFENGVTLADILKHFTGSTEAAVVDVLNCME